MALGFLKKVARQPPCKAPPSSLRHQSAISQREEARGIVLGFLKKRARLPP
eukprot:m.187089 g.187089  ORF g.187089 m.187089 type:complete len:51 (+) comp10012_c2_seq23:241-393(+)